MVKYISDRIGVMHLGRLVELGTAEDIYERAIHPYTRSLLSAIRFLIQITNVIVNVLFMISQKVDYYKGSWTEVAPGHFVLGTDEEIKQWKSEC